jgi:hypothetical protein
MKKMNAEKFLKDSNLSSVADGDTLGLKVVYEDDVIYLMEKYHQSKVNNVALDDVRNSFSHEIIEKIRNSKSDAEARRHINRHIKNCF